jgi:hypothetical protein
MFNHENFATHGLYPGFVSTRTVGNLGAFDIEVTITPVVLAPGGGGYVPSQSGKPDRYRVVVRVKINGVWTEDVQIVDDNRARVSARFNGITEFTEDAVMVSFNGVQVKEQVVNVEVINNKKNTGL